MDAADWAGNVIPLQVELIVFVSTLGPRHVGSKLGYLTSCEITL